MFDKQPLVKEICTRLSEGEPLAQICRDPHMPGVTTVWEWAKADEAISESIARARIEGFDAIAEESLEIIDTVPERAPTQFGDHVDAGHVSWLKARADHRLKLLAKWDPKRYGDKQQVEHSGSIDTAATILEARKRSGG